MREPENIRAVEQTGADWMGFICYEGSPRYVADVPRYLPRQAKRVGARHLPDITRRRLPPHQGIRAPKHSRPAADSALRLVVRLPALRYALHRFRRLGHGVRLEPAPALRGQHAFPPERRHPPRKPRSPEAFPSSPLGRHRPKQRLRNRSGGERRTATEDVYRGGQKKYRFTTEDTEAHRDINFENLRGTLCPLW